MKHFQDRKVQIWIEHKQFDPSKKKKKKKIEANGTSLAKS